MGPDGASWDIGILPTDNAEREVKIASLFIAAFEKGNVCQSLPSLAPFGKLVQNPVDDIDFSVLTSHGQLLMELAEFAPNDKLGTRFSDAPDELHPSQKSVLAFELIEKKSQRQGGPNRFLVIYASEYGFSLDDITIELLRRFCCKAPPKFDRVFYVSMPICDQSKVSEIYPGMPHFWYGERTIDELKNVNVSMPHPRDLIENAGIDENGGNYISIMVPTPPIRFTPWFIGTR